LSAVADVGYIAIIVAGFGAYWWRTMRAMHGRVRTELAPDAEIALHVADHEAGTRQQWPSSLHVLYGLLQDDGVIAAIRDTGGDPDALEDRVLAAFARPVAASGQPREDRGDPTPAFFEHAQIIRQITVEIAQRHARRVTCGDLWAALAGTWAGALIDEAALDRGGVLFRLCHGDDPPLPIADALDVIVIVRNDDYTTQQFVCEVLGEVFELPPARAIEVMLATHQAGRGVIGRFATAAARAKITEARARAKRHGYPLWIGVEPA
jgi:ATP-dependent Clp protease adaptor protein ClpS